MYDLELNKIIALINEKKYSKVLIQLPDGLKTNAKDIVDEIESKTKSTIFIWFGSCYGACDLPDFSRLNIDLFVQFGHNEFVKEWD